MSEFKNKLSFSAKDLVSKPAMQLKLYIEHPEKRPQVSAMAYEGESWQHKIAKTLKMLLVRN